MANHVAAPMPGKVSSVAVRPGQVVQLGERLVSIEAMKMETDPGSVVEARDLLITLKD